MWGYRTLARNSMGGVTPDRSREVPIPERSGTAFRKGPGLARPIRSVPFRLQNLGCPGLRARGSLGSTPRALSGLLAPGAGASQHAGRAATPATVLRRLFLCFCFSRRSPVTRCRCCQGRPPVLLRVLAGSAAAVRVAQTKATGGPTPAQRGGAGAGGVETGPATFLDPGGRSREAQRSGFSPWKRSFCASGRDRDRTVSCRWRLAICKRAELSEDRQRFLWTFPT